MRHMADVKLNWDQNKSMSLTFAKLRELNEGIDLQWNL